MLTLSFFIPFFLPPFFGVACDSITCLVFRINFIWFCYCFARCMQVRYQSLKPMGKSCDTNSFASREIDIQWKHQVTHLWLYSPMEMWFWWCVSKMELSSECELWKIRWIVSFTSFLFVDERKRWYKIESEEKCWMKKWKGICRIFVFRIEIFGIWYFGVWVTRENEACCWKTLTCFASCCSVSWWFCCRPTQYIIAFKV